MHSHLKNSQEIQDEWQDYQLNVSRLRLCLSIRCEYTGKNKKINPYYQQASEDTQKNFEEIADRARIAHERMLSIASNLESFNADFEVVNLKLTAVKKILEHEGRDFLRRKIKSEAVLSPHEINRREVIVDLCKTIDEIRDSVRDSALEQANESLKVAKHVHENFVNQPYHDISSSKLNYLHPDNDLTSLLKSSETTKKIDWDACGKKLIEKLNDTYDHNKALEKNSTWKKFSIGLLNAVHAIFGIATLGAIPCFKKLFTGSFFYSLDGKSKDAVKEAKDLGVKLFKQDNKAEPQQLKK